MRTKRHLTLFLGLLLGAAGRVAADPPPTPAAAEQHVTVPSLPGQRNKETTVRPSGELKTDRDGNLVTSRQDPAQAPASTTRPAGASAPAGVGSASQSTAAPAPSTSVGPATSRGTATGVNIITVRGVVKAIDPGRSVTVTLQRSKKELTYTLTKGASVPGDLKPGDAVKVRILAAEKGRITDRVERLEKKTTRPPGA